METKNTERKFKEVALLDVCHPDYFTGYPYAVLSVMVYPNMTSEELGTAIKDAVNQDYEYLSYDYNENDILLFEEFADNVIKNGDTIEVDSCECEDDECECEHPYLYLGLCNPVVSGGLKFLN